MSLAKVKCKSYNVPKPYFSVKLYISISLDTNTTLTGAAKTNISFISIQNL